MTHNAIVRQRDLFEADERLKQCRFPVQREQLAGLIEALLREIATALMGREVDDDQDHGSPPRPRRLSCSTCANRPPDQLVHNQESLLYAQYGLAGREKGRCHPKVGLRSEPVAE